MIVTRFWAVNSQKASDMDSNPCWEDLYDDDCVMENAAAAGFVAAQWIRSMPCGEGIAVRVCKQVQPGAPSLSHCSRRRSLW